MAVFKRVLCQDRLRRVPPQFSWIDHRLVLDRHISRCSANALALYLFLITVADGQGLSYYADPTIHRLLPPLDAQALEGARRELIAHRLIAYQRPLYQVLALPLSASAPQARPAPGDGPDPGPQSFARIFQQLMEPKP